MFEVATEPNLHPLRSFADFHLGIFHQHQQKRQICVLQLWWVLSVEIRVFLGINYQFSCIIILSCILQLSVEISLVWNIGLVEAKVPCNLLVECFTCGVVYNLSYVLHTAGRYLVKRFRKAQCPIVERLTNSLMMHGRNNGKKLMAVRIVKHAMEIIYLLTDQNPIQVIVDAIINSGPREDATRIGSAGVVRRQAVDISPLRRVNQAIYLLTTGNRESAFRNIKTIAECLADELINAAKGSSNSYAIKKKDEIERVAKANR
ncbi:hypothetical protein ES288_A10G053000v1 [Gossypium darwinii]|uniref:Small ribosomal subunit protein uS7 domain-containing protein n=1 Tax=Gossypium darwinii TaxID=34276 RepID=A0A5D2EV60_GOSDA|nr:hypothetical protein ES288_A10G053000v1 [Gossypium darwinii]